VSSYFKFLRRVRIHGRECGAVARALRHKIGANPLSAADRKVLSTTNERKVMSNSTFFKRIALTAIAALGFGMLSVAPSQASVASHTLTIDAATDALDAPDSASAVLTHQFAAIGSASAADSVTLRAIFASQPLNSTAKIFLTIRDSYTGAANDATANNSPDYNFGYGSGALAAHPQNLEAADAFPSVYSGGVDSLTVIPDEADSVNTTSLGLKLYGASVGTYVINVFTQVNSAGSAASTTSTPSTTWTVTVSSPDAAATAASSVSVRTGTAALSTGVEGSDSSTLYSAYDALATDTSPEATVWVKLKTGLATNYAKESFTVTVTGEAFITTTSTSDRPSTGEALAVKALTMAVPTADTEVGVRVWSSTTAGTATLSVTTAGGVALGSKTFTFSGAPTTLTNVLQYKKVIQANKGSAESAVIAIKVTDAAGNAVIGYAPAVVGSNGSAAASGTCADVSTADASTRDGTYVCTVVTTAGSTSGMTSTMTARIDDPETTGTQYFTSTFDVTLGGAVSTVVLTTDKASYAPGEYMVIKATAKDSSGNTPYDGQSGPTLTANKSLGGAISMNAYYDGVSTSETRSSNPRVMTTSQNVFAPAASGEFLVRGTDGQATPVAISVKATVTDDGATAAANAASDAAAEAIDAANAATDAANLAAEAADAATVAAEEARDAADAATAAVEALATEVATLMAALKAQITTLANTVAKIAKKVKA
jgi:hypothetical protein